MSHDEVLPPMIDDAPWWRSAVVYQIYPRSFCDTTGNGVGDLEGVIARLDHLEWLGVDAIWLSPVFPSPMVDHGYDVADYCDIDPLFGDLATMDRLLAAAHERGIRVVLDWVPNHSSDQHPWFVASRSSRDDPKRDWYIWRDGHADTPPNNWQAVFPEGPAWTWDDTTEAWYLHLFTVEQPDLNWANPEVQAAMLDTLRFWLDRGVDGFRMDVVHAIGKPEGLPDRPAGPGTPLAENDVPVTHDYLRAIRAVLDDYPGERMSVGEVYLLEPERVADYYGDDDELHLSFNFAALWAPWDAAAWRSQIEQATRAFEPVDAWPTWVLSNHDVTRHRQRYGGDERIARAAAVLLLGLRGTPFLYAGEELGLVDADVPAERQQDPSGHRDGCRAPIPWDDTPAHGWASPDPWLPFPPEADARNATIQRSTPGSIASLYRALLAARKRSPALRLGEQTLLDVAAGVVAWERRHHDDRRVVLVNMTGEPVAVALPPSDVGAWEVDVSSTADLAAGWDGGLPPHAAVVLRPSS